MIGEALAFAVRFIGWSIAVTVARHLPVRMGRPVIVRFYRDRMAEEGYPLDAFSDEQIFRGLAVAAASGLPDDDEEMVRTVYATITRT